MNDPTVPDRLTAAGTRELERSLAQLRTIVDEGTARLGPRPAPVTLRATEALA